MANNIPDVAPASHIPMFVLWDRHKELLGEDLPGLKSAIIHPKYYHAAKGNERDLVNLGDGTRGYFKSLRINHYRRPLAHLMNVEQAYKVLETRRYDLHDIKVKIEEDRLSFQYHGMTASGFSVYPGDQIVFKHLDQPCYHLEIIDKVKGDLIITKSTGSNSDFFSKGNKFSITFNPSGIPIYRSLQALKYFDNSVNKQKFQQMLFHDETIEAIKDKLPRTQPKIIIESNNKSKLSPSKIKLLNDRLANCNEAQRTAIKHILAGRCRPKPYILFGPPGTGKTYTLVESVIQIHLRRPELEILICVSSNVCANHVADLLHTSGLFGEEILRRILPEQRLEDLIENHLDKEYHTSETSLGKVVVTTNVKAGSIKRQFDYVFVDEAAHAHEPEALIAATRLKQDGVFVLSGDPKQLRPVIANKNVANTCLKFSMLERLYKFKLYCEKKDENYITILNETYRADQRLVALWSRLFYDNQVISKQSTTSPRELLNLFNLKDNPIGIKHNPTAESMVTSRSRFNEGEVEVCLSLVRKLRKQVRPDQIGIISMYKLQAKKIQNALVDELFRLGRARNTNQGGNQGNGQNKKKNKKNKSQQLGQEQQLEETSIEKSWLELEKKVIQMRLSWNRRQKRTNSDDKSSSHIRPTTIDDLPLLVDTVDSFQGDEREIIIISTVRSPGIESFKFIHDPRRFNVAISRAKWLLIAVGNKDVLKGGLHWRGYLDAATNI